MDPFGKRVAAMGRFQPFHWGHYEYLIEASLLGTQLVVGITNPTASQMRVTDADPARSTREANLFSYEERCEMIKLTLDRLAPHLDVLFTPCDLRSPSLLRASLGQCETVAVTIYDAWGEERAGLLRDAGYNVVVLWRRQEKLVSGTEVRRRISGGMTWEQLVPHGTTEVVQRILRSRGMAPHELRTPEC